MGNKRKKREDFAVGVIAYGLDVLSEATPKAKGPSDSSRDVKAHHVFGQLEEHSEYPTVFSGILRLVLTDFVAQ